MDITPYGGWNRCAHVSNGVVEAVATLDVGPRIIRFGFVREQNLFKEFTGDLGLTGGDKWRIYGGHRLWHAPEQVPRSYCPDNGPVEHRWDGTTLILDQPPEPSTGMAKTVKLTLSQDSATATVAHILRNTGPWDVELAPWALSVMAPGGQAVLPQEPFQKHGDALLPARPVVLWPYTNMADPRWTWAADHIALRQDSTIPGSQKVGVRNTRGWAAYELNNQVFVVRSALEHDAPYPDFGCNYELFTNGDMLEIETLGPLMILDADGGTCEHVEYWELQNGTALDLLTT